MEEHIQNYSAATDVKKAKKKKIIAVIVAVVVIAVVAIIVYSAVNKNAKYAGVYYSISENYEGDYFFSGSKYYIELTKDGKFIEEGFLGSYEVKSGKITLIQSALGMTVMMNATVKNGVLIVNDNSASSPIRYYYVKLDTPPENGQVYGKLPF